ncbi:hypothetical protein RFI_18165, partial [Reticulomyxa filosa]
MNIDTTEKESFKYELKVVASKTRNNRKSERASIRYLVTVTVKKLESTDTKEKSDGNGNDNEQITAYLRVWQPLGDWNHYSLIQSLRYVRNNEDLQRYVAQFGYTGSKCEEKMQEWKDLGLSNLKSSNEIEIEIIGAIENHGWDEIPYSKVNICIGTDESKDYQAMLDEYCSYGFFTELSFKFALSDIDTCSSCVLSNCSSDTRYDAIQECERKVKDLIQNANTNTNTSTNTNANTN